MSSLMEPTQVEPGLTRKKYRSLVSRLGLALVWLLLGFAVALVVGGALGLLTRVAFVQHLNRTILIFFLQRRVPWLNSTMSTVTGMGSYPFVIGVAAVAGALASIRDRSILPLGLLELTLLGMKLIQEDVVKFVHAAPPPSVWSIGLAGGFPSGGVCRVMTVFGGAAFLLARGSHRVIARMLWTVVVASITLEGFSRLYLGRHWAMDVLGGLVIGACWLSAVVGASLIIRPRRPHRE